MASEWYIKVSGAYKEVNEAFVKVSGAWKEIQEGYIKVSGAWKKLRSFCCNSGYHTDINWDSNCA